MNGTTDRAVDRYLERLRRSLSDLPAGRRGEIVDEIEEHIAEALAEIEPVATDADVRNALERVGDPDDIAAEARERLGIGQAKPIWSDVAAIALLLVGSVSIMLSGPPEIGFVGWVLGIVLMWICDVWSTRDKTSSRCWSSSGAG
jgi:uncharacterized membrane protein